MDASALDALADRFFAAVAEGDAATLETLYAPDAAVWMNTTGAAQDREANLAMLAGLHDRIGRWRYDEVRRDCFDGGFVQQHVLRATNAAGEEVAMPACVVVRVDGDRITRIDEYLDSRAARALVAG